MKALLLTGYADTVEEVAGIAESLCATTNYDLLVGGSYGALLSAHIAIGNHASLVHVAQNLLLRKKWLFWKKRLNVSDFYTEKDHHLLRLSLKEVYVPLLNMSTKSIEYFNLALCCYEQAVLVLSAAMLSKRSMITINGHVYLDGTIVENCAFWYVSNFRYVDAIDIIFARPCKKPDPVQWVPTSKSDVLLRLFHVLRCEANSEKAEYEIRTISEVREINTKFYYLKG